MNFKRIISFVLALALCTSVATIFVSANSVAAYYSTIGTATSSTIEISDSTLKAAKTNAQKYTSDFFKTACINKQYQTHIYHFKAPNSGYYAFYTTGSLDTIIKVYEEQNFLWHNWYKDLGKNDDGGHISSNSLSSNLVLELDEGEDYYVCIRGFNTKVGYYTLKVEENEDKLLASKYPSLTKWEGDNLSVGHSLSGTYTMSKQYLTPIDTIFLYWSLDPAIQNQVTNNIDYIYVNYCQSIQKGLNSANNIISGLSFLSSFVDGLSVWVGIALSSVSVLVTVFSYAIDELDMEWYEMLELLAQKCGVSHNLSAGTWSATSGLLITKTLSPSSLCSTKYDYTANNSSIRTGVKNDKGHWNS